MLFFHKFETKSDKMANGIIFLESVNLIKLRNFFLILSFFNNFDILMVC